MSTDVRWWLSRPAISLVLTVIVWASAPRALAQETVLNMSHDLVRLGIASQNLAPDTPALDARPLFQAAIAYLYSHQIQVLTLDKGNYYFLSEQFPPYIGLAIGSLSNLTIDLAGSTLWYSNPMAQGFDVSYCKNLVLTNFTTDFLNLPYSHASLTSVDATNRILHYSTISGLPDPATSKYVGAQLADIFVIVFRNGQVVPGTTKMTVQLPMTSGTIQLVQDGSPWTQSATLSTLQPGDTVAVTWRGGQPRVEIWNGDGVTLSNVNVYGSSGWAIAIDESRNTTVDQVRILPRPGFGLIGSDADGIHFNNTGPNNHIRNSYITRTVDDGIAVDALELASVSSQPSSRQLVVNRAGLLRFPNGTAVNFVDQALALESAGGTIVSQVPADSQNPNSGEQVTLTFDRDLPTLKAGTEMVMGTATLRGSGTTIEDNFIEDIPFGRAIWLSGVEGVTAQRNVVRRTADAAVAVQYETTVFPGPPAHDVLVQNNVFEAVLGPMAQGEGSLEAMGSIVVSATGQPDWITANSPNTNISIINNFISDSGRSGIWFGQTTGGIVSGNLITRWYQHPELPNWGAPASAVQDFNQPLVLTSDPGVTTGTNDISPTSSVTAPVRFMPASASFGSSGGQGSFALATAIPGFEWNANASDSWITIRTAVPASGASAVDYAVAANFTSAARTGSITIAGETFSISQAAGPEVVVPQSGWWWDPNLNGTGFFVEYGGKSGSGVFIGGFLYDSAGTVTWLVSTGQMNGASFSGGWLKATGGQTLLGFYKAPSLTPAGNLTLTFSDSTHALMTRPDGTKINLVRFSFSATSTPAVPMAGAPQSGWWWAGSALAGTGYGIEIQGSGAFLVAYVYDDLGNPVWYLATGSMISANTFAGTWDVYAGGPQLTSPEGTYAAHKVSSASPMTLTFSDAAHGTLTMGSTTIPITRFQEF